MSIKININLTNKWLYSIIAVVVIVALGIGVFAFTYVGSIPNPGHGADGILVDVGGVETDLQDAITTGLIREITWNSIDGTIVTKAQFPWTAGTSSYDLSLFIPTNANEVLVFIWARKGNTGGPEDHTYNIYTQELGGTTKYIKKFYYFEFAHDAWSFNSDTFWLPVTGDKTLYVELIGTVTGNKAGEIHIIGWR